MSRGKVKTCSCCKFYKPDADMYSFGTCDKRNVAFVWNRGCCIFWEGKQPKRNKVVKS